MKLMSSEQNFNPDIKVYLYAKLRNTYSIFGKSTFQFKYWRDIFTMDGVLNKNCSYLPSNLEDNVTSFVVRTIGIFVEFINVCIADQNPLSSSNTTSTWKIGFMVRYSFNKASKFCTLKRKVHCTQINEIQTKNILQNPI